MKHLTVTLLLIFFKFSACLALGQIPPSDEGFSDISVERIEQTVLHQDGQNHRVVLPEETIVGEEEESEDKKHQKNTHHSKLTGYGIGSFVFSATHNHQKNTYHSLKSVCEQASVPLYILFHSWKSDLL